MPSVGDILKITACQNLFNETVCNVFYYIVAAWTGNLDLDDVLDEFVTTVGSPISEIQSDDLTWSQLHLDNVTNGIEFADKDTGLPVGQETGDSAPSYVAMAFKLNRATGVTRNGAKRFAGLNEGTMAANNWSLYQSVNAQDVQTALASNLILDVNDELEPVIVGRLPSGGLDLTKINPIASATARQKVSSQVSRKAPNA